MSRKDFEKFTDKISATNIANDSTDIVITHYGYQNTAPDKEYVSGMNSPCIRLHYITRGSCYLHVGKHPPVKLGKNTFLVLFPNVDMGYVTDAEDPVSTYWVAFSGKLSLNIIKRAGFSIEHPYLATDTKPEEFFYKNFNIAENKMDTKDIVFLQNFYDILEPLITEHANNTEKHTDRKLFYVSKAIDYINENYHDAELCLPKVAKHIGIHEKYLSTIFKMIIGASFSNYVTQKRLQSAIALMDKGWTDISEISFQVGFENPFYFTKLFKKYNSIPPSEHIRKLKEQGKIKQDKNSSNR